MVAGLSRTTPTNDQHIQIDVSLFGVCNFSQRQTFRFGQQDILRKVRVDERLNIFCISPSGSTILRTTPVFPGILGFLVHDKPQQSAAGISHQQVKRMQAGQGIGKGFPDFKERPQNPIQHIAAGCHAVRLPQLGSHQADQDIRQSRF